MLTHQHHGHDHGDGAGPHTHLTSVGIDIGSSTSHLMFSQLRIGYPSPHERKPQILERVVIARSAILLTPFAGDWNIQPEPLKKLVDSTALNIGARLVAYDENSCVTRVEKAGHRFLSDLGHDLQIGGKIDESLRARVATRMARVLFDALAGAKPPWDDLFVTHPLRGLPKVEGILFWGGVAEYIN